MAPARVTLTDGLACRFQRLIRTFAEALYFKQLAHVVGQDVLGQEKGLTDDQRRVLVRRERRNASQGRSRSRALCRASSCSPAGMARNR